MPDTRESLRKKKLAYLRTFCGPGETPHVNAVVVLADLKKFCGVTKPGVVVSQKSGMADPILTGYLAGQRDVYQRICGYLGIDEFTLFNGDTHEQASISKAADT
jgi:hypothetical protein